MSCDNCPPGYDCTVGLYATIPSQPPKAARQLTPTQAAALKVQWDAACELIRAVDAARESERYGRATEIDKQHVAAAEKTWTQARLVAKALT